MNEHFFWPRLAHLVRGDLINIYRSVAVVAATLACLMLVNGLILANNRSSFDSYGLWALGMLFVWGPVFASKAFQELHDRTRCDAYLLLPASALEKMLSRVLIAIVVFPMFVLLFVTVVSWANLAIGSSLFDFAVPVFRFGAGTWDLLGHFVVVQSLFLLGAAWFRRSQFIKTVLSLTLVLIGFGFVTGLAIYFFFFGLLAPDALSRDGIGEALAALSVSHETLLDVALAFWLSIYGLALPAFCWTVAWLRIREAQVSHGV